MLDLFAPGVLLTGGVTERLGDVTNGRLGPVGDDVGDLGRMVAVVVVINVLNSLFTPVGLDIDVDVRWPIPVRGEEPFEKQFVAHRVDGSDLQCVADR